MLDYTPWLELVQCGVNSVVNSDSDLIYETAMRKLKEVAQQEFPVGLYGDGHAGKKIVEILSRSRTGS